ncbi:MAG TPA: DUF397 domain-containing protein [Actinophytocola sp.]|nr:DUF397 domain-containing protein [Actinophytocola sp.]HEV2779351.1 DUF397 domain-containing protein [Actinophytocola sp.]
MPRTDWRKSSFSGGINSNCVEVALDASAWRKSSHSQGGVGSDCVEVALDAATFVRDSKNVGGPVLTFDVPAWRRFVAYMPRA